MTAPRSAVLAALAAALVACESPPPLETGGVTAGWPVYGGDAGGSRHSPLDQINRDNVRFLKEAWRIRTGDLDVDPPPPGHMAFQSTPILVGGLLVLPTPLGRVLALDPETGAERWRFDATVESRRYPEFTSRGVAAWSDPAAPPGAPCRERIFAATIASRLYAIDATDGKRCTQFGASGEVSLREGVGEIDGFEYQISSPPTMAGDLVVVGSAIADNRRVAMPKGIVRAYDARSGALAWAWDPIPRSSADPAYAEWRSEDAARVGAANAWSILSYDAARDLVFVPTGSASPDFYGGERKGANQWANSVVALRAADGSLAWAFQVVHHDLWDYDVPAQPTLVRVRRDGRRSACRGPGHQDGNALPPRSRDGSAAVPGRGAPGTQERRAGRGDVADAAVPDPAAPARAPAASRPRMPSASRPGIAEGAATAIAAASQRRDLHAAEPARNPHLSRERRRNGLGQRRLRLQERASLREHEPRRSRRHADPRATSSRLRAPRRRRSSSGRCSARPTP